MNRLDGRVALVTGGASGIGAATAERLAAEGARVVVADVDRAGADGVVATIRAAGGDALGVTLDVADEGSWHAALAATREAYGALHVLFNNAGVSGAMLSVDDYDLATWNRIIAINQTGVFLGVKHGGALIKASGGGSIINTSSIHGIVGSPIDPGYAASKGAVRTLTKNAAIAWAQDGIRVNSIHPGPIETPILGSAPRDLIRAETPMGRIGEPSEIAGVVAFLASDDAS